MEAKSAEAVKTRRGKMKPEEEAPRTIATIEKATQDPVWPMDRCSRKWIRNQLQVVHFEDNQVEVVPRTIPYLRPTAPQWSPALIRLRPLDEATVTQLSLGNAIADPSDVVPLKIC